MKISKYMWDVIASYMDDEIRERLHSEYAPCTEAEFLQAYMEEDPEFNKLMLQFGIADAGDIEVE